MKCNKCENEIKENEKFCTNCGEPVTATPEVKKEEPKKSNLGLIIGIGVAGVILLIIAIIVVIVIALLFVGKTVTDITETTTIIGVPETTTTAKNFDDDKGDKKVKELDFSNVTFKAEDDHEESKNIEYVTAFMNTVSYEGASRYAYVGVINKNSTNVDIWVYINYYKDGVRIGSDDAITSFVKPNVLTVVDVDLAPKDEYDSFDITVKTSVADSYMVDVPVTDKNFKKVNTDSKTEKTFGKFTNDSKNEVYGYASCVRYKDDKIVYLQRGYIGTVKVGKTADCTCYKTDIPSDLDYNKTECIPFNVYYTDGE